MVTRGERTVPTNQTAGMTLTWTYPGIYDHLRAQRPITQRRRPFGLGSSLHLVSKVGNKTVAEIGILCGTPCVRNTSKSHTQRDGARLAVRGFATSRGTARLVMTVLADPAGGLEPIIDFFTIGAVPGNSSVDLTLLRAHRGRGATRVMA